MANSKNFSTMGLHVDVIKAVQETSRELSEKTGIRVSNSDVVKLAIQTLQTQEVTFTVTSRSTA